MIDDFAHNPDKIDATLATLRAQPGRLLIMFQPHGYGPLAKMGEELADSLAGGMGEGDRLYLPDPVYQGGTVEQDARQRLARRRGQRARQPGRPHSRAAAIGEALLAEAKDGDRILIMGARDDTLIDFAAAWSSGWQSELIGRSGVEPGWQNPEPSPAGSSALADRSCCSSNSRPNMTNRRRPRDLARRRDARDPLAARGYRAG